jgi:predicted alpha/beta superfamily hydrolase
MGHPAFIIWINAQKEATMSKNYPRTSLFSTEERTILCSKIGREYHLSVWLPQSYATSNQDYPVIYLLDGDLVFGMAASLTALLHWGGTQEVVVVGIGYDMESYDQWGTLRELDFKIPEVKDAPSNSYADLFLDALTHEMIPFIEANYRTIPSDRCLYGYSSSGFFVLYALFNQPDAFRRYLCGSGDLNIAYPYFIKRDQKLAERISNNQIELYLSVGELEENLTPYFHKLISFLENKKYPSLKLITEIYKGEQHGSEGAALTYLHGIRNVYPTVRSTE